MTMKAMATATNDDDCRDDDDDDAAALARDQVCVCVSLSRLCATMFIY